MNTIGPLFSNTLFIYAGFKRGETMLRWVLLAVCIAVIGRAAPAEDNLALDGLRAKMAAQEALMNDFEAKLAATRIDRATADGITSLRKNAVVTVGGYLSTGYYGLKYTAKSIYDENLVAGPYSRRAENTHASLEISDADLYVDIKVNEHFDAFLYLDLDNTGDNDGYGLAKAYWIRWKNICNTGFGLKAGRDRLVFGSEGYGYLDSFAVGSGDGMSWIEGPFYTTNPNMLGGSGFAGQNYGPVPLHNGWKINGATQITPYWESGDGNFVAELSFMQNVDNTGARRNLNSNDSTYFRTRNGYAKHRTRNDGWGTMSARATYTPMEDLTLTAGLVNFHSKAFSNDLSATSEGHAKNNTALSLSLAYRPGFLSRLNTWAQWIHGWNVDNFKGLDSDVVNAGLSWDFTDNLTAFAQGDYLKSRYKHDGLDNRGTAWAAYGGLMYSFANGAVLESGWRHEQAKFKENGRKASTFTGDIIYANLGFEF